jgi:DNA polymerase III alpha subunit
MYTPLLNRTHYSVLKAFSKPPDLARMAKESGYTYCGICDFGSLSGSVEFVEACMKVGVTPILGCDINSTYYFARNLAGWKDLISLVSSHACNTQIKPQILNSDNLITVSEEVSGKHHFTPESLGLKDCRYPTKEDEESYRILRCMSLKTVMRKLEEPTSGYEFPTTPLNFDDRFTQLLEPYSFFSRPKLPSFGNRPEIEVLRELAEEGFSRLAPKDKIDQYRDRLEKELKVIEFNNLAGYFLIVWDFIKYARDRNILVGCGRGSAAGCLVSYLTGITLIDPIPYGLLFSRFFNAARSYPKHLSFDEYPFVDKWRDVAI